MGEAVLASAVRECCVLVRHAVYARAVELFPTALFGQPRFFPVGLACCDGVRCALGVLRWTIAVARETVMAQTKKRRTAHEVFVNTAQVYIESKRRRRGAFKPWTAVHCVKCARGSIITCLLRYCCMENVRRITQGHKGSPMRIRSKTLGRNKKCSRNRLGMIRYTAPPPLGANSEGGG